jgi:DEAD/DEAH box helicase domain-containing protein
MDSATRYERLAKTPRFRKTYDELRSRPATIAEWGQHLGLGTDDCERLLEVAAHARAEIDVIGRKETHTLLPLRIHAFHRTEPGIFVCINPKCGGRNGTKLDHLSWRYGAVFHDRIERCPDCRSLILELKLCSNCGNETLAGERFTHRDGVEEVRLPAVSATDDEFEYDLVDEQSPDGTQDDDSGTNRFKDDDPAQADILLTASGHGAPCAIDRNTGKVLETGSAEAVLFNASGGETCPSCDATLAGRGNARLYPFRLGAPFLLGNIIPELLEDASAADSARQSAGGLRFKPADGKQLLTFTDSRQGTARLSAKLQAEAERSYVRAYIYHAVQDAATAGVNAAELAKIDKDIADIEGQLALVPMGDLRKILESVLDGKVAERERLTKPRGIGWPEIVDRLSADRTVRYIREKIWLDRDTNQFGSDREFAKFLLLREFFRRPRRANSAETLGLARLTAPAIEGQTKIGIPSEFKDRGGTLQDWKDFLAVTLTWYVRANSLVIVPRDLKRFIHRRIPTGHLIGPHAERRDATLQRQWPRQVSESWRLPAFVRLLMQGLKVDIADPGQRADAEAILLKAWDALYPALQSGNDGYQLDFEKLEIMALENAWLCPVTRRVLDRSFRRLTPYPAIAGSSSEAEFRAVTPIELPRLPFPFGKTDGREVSSAEIDAWLGQDDRVVAGRERGIWGDLHDAIARRRSFFRAAEHSAQQPGWRLRAYEAEFRQGLINVLNCSTTMEMGVDIGSICTVAMTNMPPSLASYRQRIGRAGRSGQTMSLGFTLCKRPPTRCGGVPQPYRHAGAHNARSFRAARQPCHRAAPRQCAAARRISAYARRGAPTADRGTFLWMRARRKRRTQRRLSQPLICRLGDEADHQRKYRRTAERSPCQNLPRRPHPACHRRCVRLDEVLRGGLPRNLGSAWSGRFRFGPGSAQGNRASAAPA